MQIGRRSGTVEGPVLVYLGSVILLIIGFVLGWTMRGDQERIYLHGCNTALASTETRLDSCNLTLEQTWKQMRSLSSESVRCRYMMDTFTRREIR